MKKERLVSFRFEFVSWDPNDVKFLLAKEWWQHFYHYPLLMDLLKIKINEKSAICPFLVKFFLLKNKFPLFCRKIHCDPFYYYIDFESTIFILLFKLEMLAILKYFFNFEIDLCSDFWIQMSDLSDIIIFFYYFQKRQFFRVSKIVTSILFLNIAKIYHIFRIICNFFRYLSSVKNNYNIEYFQSHIWT